MSTTRLYVACPNCRVHYLMKKDELKYSNGAYIENVAGAPEWQRLLCPCRPETPYKFKLSETVRLHVFSNDEHERTHFSPIKKKE
jgi:ferredoxin